MFGGAESKVTDSVKFAEKTRFHVMLALYKPSFSECISEHGDVRVWAFVVCDEAAENTPLSKFQVCSGIT